MRPYGESGLIKKMLVGVLVLALTLIGYRVLLVGDVNAQVAAELHANPQGDRAQKSMLVTLADGREYPVNFLQKDNTLYVGIDGLWWREFSGDGQLVSLLLKGRSLEGQAKVVLDDRELRNRIFAELRPKWPKWLPAWLNGKLVVIELHSAEVPTSS